MTKPHRRSKVLKGSYEDANRWIRCWNCGFINDRSKLSLPNRSGASPHWEQISDTERVCSGDPNKAVITNQFIEVEGEPPAVLLQTRNDGETKIDYYHPFLPRVVAGCAFCGRTNLP